MSRYRRTRHASTESSHRFGGLSTTARAYETLSRINRQRVALHKAWLDGRLPQKDYWRRDLKLRDREDRVKIIAAREEFHPGDVVETPRGKLKVTGSHVEGYGYRASRTYETVNERGVRDLIPAQMMRRRVR